MPWIKDALPVFSSPKDIVSTIPWRGAVCCLPCDGIPSLSVFPSQQHDISNRETPPRLQPTCVLDWTGLLLNATLWYSVRGRLDAH